MSLDTISLATAADLDFILGTGVSSAPKLSGTTSTQKSAVGSSKTSTPLSDDAHQEWDSGITFKAEPLIFKNPCDFHEFFWPKVELVQWQEQTLRQFAGSLKGSWEEELFQYTPEIPFLYSLAAANGSGKSALILARCALWYIATKVHSKAVITSESFSQLKNQTFKAISQAAQDVNDFLGEKYFVVTEVKVVCPKTRSTIFGFATDQPGRAEGYHPDVGGVMCVLIDEAKSITDEMYEAFSRFTGFSEWLEVSSPGAMSGQFYKGCQLAKSRANKDNVESITPGKNYFRRVTAFECPWVTKNHIEQFGLRHGTNSAVYRSSILAEFTSLDDGAVIKQEKTLYTPPPFNDLGQPKRAGVDLSAGGDEQVFICTWGNRIIEKCVWNIEDVHRLVVVLIDKFEQHGLEAENINLDGGGLGKVIIQMIRANPKWEGVMSINNESAAYYKREFKNRGMEMYWKLLRLIEEKVLILPHEDTTLMTQLVTRRGLYSSGKMGLEPKSTLSESPDRADAYALAYASVPIDEVLGLWRGMSQVINAASKSQTTDSTTLTEADLRNFLSWRRDVTDQQHNTGRPRTCMTDRVSFSQTAGMTNFLSDNQQYQLGSGLL